MTRSLRILAVALASVLAPAGCDGKVAGGAADGAAVFREACARCHGDLGTPTESMRAQLGVKDLRAAEFHARATREHVIHQVQRGSDNKIMPSFAGALTDAQIEAVADYVLSLRAP